MQSAVPELEWKVTAQSDLLAIIGYIADHNPDAAQSLKDEIERKVSHLPENPRLYRAGRVEGTREMVVRPNYVVIYTETPEKISVLRVLHAVQQWPEVM